MKVCLICEKEITRRTKESYSQFRKRKFCSNKCVAKHNSGNKHALGRKHTKEELYKISESCNGNKHWNWKGGMKNCSICGKKLSTRNGKLCRKCLSSIHTGENSFNWKGGVSKDKQYLSWIKNKRNRLKRSVAIELGTHNYGDWELLKKQYNYTCPCCGLSEPKIKLTEDHIIPLSRGGSDLIENIQPLCLSCNIRKHTKIIKY